MSGKPGLEEPGTVPWSELPAPTLAATDAPGDDLPGLLDRLAAVGDLPDVAARDAADGCVAALATPPGALGALGALAAGLAGIAGTCPPPVPSRPAAIVAVGDHGIHAQQVSPWPQEISAIVAGLVAEGRAGASAMATVARARTVVLDVGLATPVAPHPRLLAARVLDGTGDASVGDAMTGDEVVRALLVGARLTDALVAEGCDLVVLGDVGIGNTTVSAALIAAATGVDGAGITGRGSGIDDATLARKRDVVVRLADRARGRGPLERLAVTGGAEHAALAGAVLAAAAARVPVLLDGIVTDAAAVLAVELAPAAAGALIAGHRSPEPAAGAALEWLGLRPLIDLDLRLGEGSGALLAVPAVVAAARLLQDVATLADVLE